jgi:hypothetical protein
MGTIEIADMLKTVQGHAQKELARLDKAIAVIRELSGTKVDDSRQTESTLCPLPHVGTSQRRKSCGGRNSGNSGTQKRSSVVHITFSDSSTHIFDAFIVLTIH